MNLKGKLKWNQKTFQRQQFYVKCIEDEREVEERAWRNEWRRGFKKMRITDPVWLEPKSKKNEYKKQEVTQKLRLGKSQNTRTQSGDI